MQQCWAENPHSRPPFSRVVSMLEHYLVEAASPVLQPMHSIIEAPDEITISVGNAYEEEE